MLSLYMLISFSDKTAFDTKISCQCPWWGFLHFASDIEVKGRTTLVTVKAAILINLEALSSC